LIGLTLRTSHNLSRGMPRLAILLDAIYTDTQISQISRKVFEMECNSPPDLNTPFGSNENPYPDTQKGTEESAKNGTGYPACLV